MRFIIALVSLLCFSSVTDAEENPLPKEILVFSVGSMTSAPELLLKISEKSVIRYADNKESTPIKYGNNLLAEIPVEFLSGSTEGVISFQYSKGYILRIIFDDGSENLWKIYLSNYEYSDEVIAFTEKIDFILSENPTKR